MKRATVLVTAVACLATTGVVAAGQPANARSDQSADAKPAGTFPGSAGVRAPESGTGAGDIAWKTCDEPGFDGTEVRCADLSVPADWKRPGGERISVGLGKLPARHPEKRLGSLLVNTGGPGPAVSNLASKGFRDKLSELTTWFDVIVIDPRGIGTSSGVTCPGAPNFAETMLSPDRRTWREHARENREWEDACRKKAGPLAGNLNSWQVAHDMEAVRQALGEGGLYYYGNSYGTVYGQAYADLFPGRVHRMFLDSARDHGERSVLKRVAPGAKLISDKFRRFGEWCETDADCALYPENARDVWDELLAEARREPLPAPGAGEGKTVGPDQFRFGTIGTVDSPSDWPRLAENLAKARNGDASGFHVTASDIPPDTSVSYLAGCSDFPFRKGWGAMTNLERRLRDFAPRVGWLLARTSYARCAGLQHQGTFPPHRKDPEGLAPVLVVSGLQDDATPPAHGRSVAEQLPGSVWIGAKEDHAVYLDNNRCVRDIVHRYLRTGDLPEPDRVCPAS